jgi:hypothetical protein
MKSERSTGMNILVYPTRFNQLHLEKVLGKFQKTWVTQCDKTADWDLKTSENMFAIPLVFRGNLQVLVHQRPEV